MDNSNNLTYSIRLDEIKVRSGFVSLSFFCYFCFVYINMCDVIVAVALLFMYVSVLSSVLFQFFLFAINLIDFMVVFVDTNNCVKMEKSKKSKLAIV